MGYVIFELTAFIVFIGINLMLPIYLIYFIVGFYQNAKGKQQEKPSAIGFFLFLLVFGVVWAIAIPNLHDYVASAKQSEAKVNLVSIWQYQQVYFSRTGTFSGGPEAFHLLAWQPDGKNGYAYYCDTAVIPNKLPLGRIILSSYLFGTSSLAGSQNTPFPNRNWPVQMKPKSSRTGFTCMAIGNIDADDTLDVWTINDGKILINELNDVKRPHFWEKWTK